MVRFVKERLVSRRNPVAVRTQYGIVILIGKQGSGKSFHTRWLRERLYADIIGMGDILRTMRTLDPGNFPKEAAELMDER